MTIKAIIFDVDGTLADTEDAHRIAFNKAFAENNLDWNWTPELYDKLLKVTNRPDIVIRKGKGMYLYDTNGNKYLDFVAGWAVKCSPAGK